MHTLPAGPYQRDRGPSQWLLRMLATQTERTELVPLIDALHERMRAEKVMDFGKQMASAARLASTFPEVGEQLRRRFRVVLLDEYQDTGHAQRVALSALFGGGVDDELALTAVGDPIQSIYGWRGASATNLPRFTTDFPRSDGSPAPTLELRTSWRNPPRALYLANAVSAEARRRSVAVQALRPRPGAEPGTIRCALLADVAAERDWVADHMARRYHDARDAGARAPTAAVLVRRNADAAPMADALTARGVPVEVVGLAGSARRHRGRRRGGDAAPGRRPERGRGRDAGAHRAAVAAGRPRHRRAVAPRGRPGRRRPGRADRASADEIVAQAAPDADTACLADAISDPGPCDAYSPEGHRRITALGHELTGAARAPRSSAARPGRRGAAGARRRRRGPGGAAAVGRLERHRTPRRLRRCGGRLRRRAARCGGVPTCSPTWTPPTVVENGLAPTAASEDHRRARPGADPHRARRQGPGVAGGGRAAPERTRVSRRRRRRERGSPTRPTCRRCCAATAPPWARTAFRCSTHPT